MLDEVLLLRRRPIDSSVFHGEAEARIPRRDPGWRWGLLVYLDLALIFLLLRFSLRIRFLRHLARIVPAAQKKKKYVYNQSHSTYQRVSNESGRGVAQKDQRTDLDSAETNFNTEIKNYKLNDN